jgi:hypothetical protein
VQGPSIFLKESSISLRRSSQKVSLILSPFANNRRGFLRIPPLRSLSHVKRRGLTGLESAAKGGDSGHRGWVRQAAVAHEMVSYYSQLETTHHVVHFPSPCRLNHRRREPRFDASSSLRLAYPECPQSELAGAAVGTNGHQRRGSHPSSSLGCRFWAA